MQILKRQILVGRMDDVSIHHQGIICGVVLATGCGCTALQKAIREHIVLIITAFCIVHSRTERKAVKCRP